MKTFIYIVLGILFGGIVGYIYASNINADRNEDIVKQEIKLLNQYNTPPPCDELKEYQDNLIQKSEDGNHVFWSYKSREKLLKKIVISSDFIVAYEAVEKVCN
jgi:hypothetical protein